MGQKMQKWRFISYMFCYVTGFGIVAAIHIWKNPHHCLQIRKKTTWDQYIAFNRSNNYGFTTNLLDSRCMCSRIHNGFFDSRHKFFGSSGFWDSRCFRGFTMRSGIHDGLVLLLHGRCNRGVQMLVF